MPGADGHTDKSPEPAGTRIEQIPPRAQFANYMVVRHTNEEFYLEFGQVHPNVQAALMFSRLVTTPEHAKRILFALKENIEKYEKVFGEIKQIEKIDAGGER